MFSIALLLIGCAGELTTNSAVSPANIRLYPTLDLLKVKTNRDIVKILLDEQGIAHAFIAVTNTKEVYHVAVSPDGNMQRELIEANSSPSNVSAAYDSTNRLHLLLDDRELVFMGSSWKINSNTIWKTAGIKVRNPRFIQAKNGIIRAFLVDGNEVGATGRWSLFGFGGYGAGIIFPWHFDSEKLLIVPESTVAKPFWYVLDPKDNLDADNAIFATDNNLNLNVIYSASRVLIDKIDEPRYAKISLSPPQSEDNHLVKGGKTELHPVNGSSIPMIISKRRPFKQIAFSVDPDTGMLLIVRAHDASIGLKHGEWGQPQKLPIPDFFWEPRLASAGGEAFHLLTVTETGMAYLIYSRGAWSTPVILGKPDVASIFGNIWSATDIASNGHNKAFAVWPTRTGIVGRWVERVDHR